jgi:hypothetical protein
MNSYLTHHDVAAWGFVVVERKQKRGEKRAGASLATGVRLGALNEARNLTSANSDTSKRTGKMTTQNQRRNQ